MTPRFTPASDRIAARMASTGMSLGDRLRAHAKNIPAPRVTAPMEQELSAGMDMLYQHRRLSCRREAGESLSADEQAQLSAIEAGYAPLYRGPRDARRFHRAKVSATIALRVRGISHTVALVDLSPGGVSCWMTPSVPPGAQVELIVDLPVRRSSYHFKARVVWQRTVHGACALGFEVVGSPVVLQHVSGHGARARRS